MLARTGLAARPAPARGALARRCARASAWACTAHAASTPARAASGAAMPHLRCCYSWRWCCRPPARRKWGRGGVHRGHLPTPLRPLVTLRHAWHWCQHWSEMKARPGVQHRPAVVLKQHRRYDRSGRPAMRDCMPAPAPPSATRQLEPAWLQTGLPQERPHALPAASRAAPSQRKAGSTDGCQQRAPSSCVSCERYPPRPNDRCRMLPMCLRGGCRRS